MAILNTGLAKSSADAAYTIDNSLRLDDGDSAYLSRTMSTPTNNKKWTLSTWFKRGNITQGQLLSAGGNQIFFVGTTRFSFAGGASGTMERMKTTQLFRDPSAWYHIVFSMDTTQSAFSDQMKLYVNGTQVTAFDTSTAITQNDNTQINSAIAHRVGGYSGGGEHWDGYLAEYYFVDGSVLDADDFGELDSDTNMWKPLDSDDVKDAVSFGNNGFYQKYGSTELADSFTDSALHQPHTVTAAGNTHTDTSVKKIGTASAQMDGTGDYLSIPHSTDFNFDTGDFTVEFWFRTTSLSDANQTLWSKSDADRTGIQSSLKSDGSINFAADNDASHPWVINETSAASLVSINTWYHYALVRNGTAWNVYLDGTSIISTTATLDFDDTSAALLFGSWSFAHDDLVGYMDEIRVSKGIARYVGPFTPSTTAFTADQYTKLLLHCDGADDGTTFTDSADAAPRHTITASGDVKNVRGADLDTTYTVIDAFTSTGADTWTCPTGVTSIELLVVAGGGGGGGYYTGGGGGAGGVIHDTSYTVVPGVVYDLTVGAGGDGGGPNTGGGSSPRYNSGDNGSNSVWNVNAEGSGITFTSVGGGGGGVEYPGGHLTGWDGGSGGGNGGYGETNPGEGTQTSPSGATGYGNDGGVSYSYNWMGGGGGADAVGADAVSGQAGAGGAGKYFGTFSSYGESGYFGGGGGATKYTTGSVSDGGIGGGGNGRHDGGKAYNGTANTGGGGGGGGGYTSSEGGDGGSGVILIAYSLEKPGSSSIEFDGTGDYLTTNADTDFNFTGDFTVDFWFKMTNLSDRQFFMGYYVGESDYCQLGARETSGSNDITFWYTSSYNLSTGTVITDSNWHHLALVRSGSTVSLAIDGVFDASTVTISGTLYFGQSQSGGLDFQIGDRAGGSNEYFGYMDEVRFSDSARWTSGFTPQRTQYTADANTKLLIHSDYTGGLGADSSGNYNSFDVTNLVATDQMTGESPTNNFCTLNPILGGAGALIEGNLIFDPDSSATYSAAGTFGATSGKWYYEFYIFDNTNNGPVGARDDAGLWDETGGPPGYCEYAPESGGQIYLDGLSTIASVGSFVATDIIGVAVNMDDGEIQWFKNGAVLSGSGNVPVTMPATTAAGFVPYTRGSGPDKYGVNFGQDSSFAGAVTAQGNQDSNGKGDFYYEPPSGFLALCTDNLSDPEIKLPGDNFNTVLYAGDDGSDRAITVGMQPDLVWFKARNAARYHALIDSVRGGTKIISSNDDAVEATTTGGITSFDSTGFDVSHDGNWNSLNNSGDNIVTWNWKAGGAPTADNSAGAGATPTAGSVKIDGSNLGSALAGSIAATRLSANTESGFSIVKWVGDGGSSSTIATGLSQQAELIINKNTSDSGGVSWVVYSSAIMPTTSNTDRLVLNTTAAEAADATIGAVTATTWQPSNGTGSVNGTGASYVTYCFHSVEGYSKVFEWDGNSSTDGVFTYLGFTPAFCLLKCYSGSSTQEWVMFDNKRNTYNVVNNFLYANDSAAESSSASRIVDFVSNGLKFRGNDGATNTSGRSYIGYAVASSPFQYSNAR